ncbi:MAG: lipoprotein release ABC transporter permease [Ignavibacteria bacterium]|nr:MAG: lipoprotein release ABC transporter permease [Ignavibacteria bacterium]
MFKNYIIIAFRHFKLFKTYSIINVVGLAIGLASCFIIYLYISYQLNFDNYNKKIDDIYLVYYDNLYAKVSEPTSPLILATTLKAEFPEIDQYARWARRTCTIKYKEIVSEEENCIFSDPTIFNILTLPLIAGNVSAFSAEDNTIILTETSANKYLGEQNPIGEIIQVNFKGEDYLLKVTAVIKDIPKSSTFVADFILPLSIIERYREQRRAKMPPNMFTLWDFPEVNTYILLFPTSNIKEFQKKLIKFSNNPERTSGGSPVNYVLFPVKDIYFHSSFMINNEFPQGDISNIYIYSWVAFLNLLISIITYLMLSIGKASLRTKEIGVRKTVGAGKVDLLKQSVIESLIITLLALPLTIILIELFLPVISQLIGQKVSSSYYHNWKYLIIFWGITVFLGIISGSYLSLYFSKFNPLDIFKNKITTGSNKTVFRKIMIAIQMIIFTALIFASVVIYQQLLFFLNKDFGFTKEGLVVFYPDDKDIRKRFEVFKNEIKTNPEIIDVSGGNILPGSNSASLIEFETMKMNMKLGVTFQQRNFNDSSKLCIINETAMKELGLTNPVSEKLMNMEIIGVVKDFNIHSLHNKIAPVVITGSTRNLNEIVIRIRKGANMLNTIDYIREKSIKFNNNRPMNFQLYDDRLGKLYLEEQNFGKIIGLFTFIAIFISCLGLFGMSLFVFNQKTKEIGIRRVVGATVPNLLYIVTKEFLFMALISAMIAFPISYFFMNKWLQNFAYRISLDVLIFMISFSIAILFVITTISFQAIKAALTNPCKSLRNE